MSSTPETRNSLIALIQDPANRDAWDQFTQLYCPVVYRLARSRGLQDADAEDLTQQVMLSISKAIGHWQRQPDTRFRHWLHRIARNAILNALSRGPKELAMGGTEFLEAVNRVPGPTSDLEAQMDYEYQRQLYRRAAEIVRSSVNADTWLAFLHTVVQGESTAVVAARLGKTVGNVHAARSRLMRRLQNVVKELMEAEDA